MANVLSGNTYYVDTVSSNADTSLQYKDVQVVGLLYKSTGAVQDFILNDMAAGDTAAVGALKLAYGNEAAGTNVFLDLSSCPIRFANGIWISTLDSGTLTLILKFK